MTLHYGTAKERQWSASLKWNDGPGWPSGISEWPWSPMTWLYYLPMVKGREPQPTYKILNSMICVSARKEFPPVNQARRGHL